MTRQKSYLSGAACVVECASPLALSLCSSNGSLPPDALSASRLANPNPLNLNILTVFGRLWSATVAYGSPPGGGGVFFNPLEYQLSVRAVGQGQSSPVKHFFKKIFFFVLLSLSLAARPAHAFDFAFGADLSFLKQAEDSGKVFKDGTNEIGRAHV